MFRSITFPGTEHKLGKSPGTFKSKKAGLGNFKDIKFVGTEGKLGARPKGFDQRKKARNRLKEFDFGSELK